MRHYARALALAAVLALGTTAGWASDRALLVGINDYNDPAWQDLHGTAVDVAKMHKVLVDDLAFPEDGIMQLTDKQATRAGILDAIEKWLIAGTSKGDRIYFYFSGHGADVTVADASGSHVTSGLAPSDVNSGVSYDAPTVGGLILGSQLRDLVLRMAGRDVTIVADACHSASLTRDASGAQVIPEGIRTITPFGPLKLDPSDTTAVAIEEGGSKGASSKAGTQFLEFNTEGGDPIPGVAVWSAVKLSQSSWDGVDGGVFTAYFVDGVHNRKAAFSADGRVTASSLLAYVRKGTADYCVTEPRCAERGFEPQILAAESYRAAIIVPYSPGGTLLPDDEPPANDDGTTNDDVTTNDGTNDDAPVNDGTAVVDLAQGLFSHENDFVLKAEILPHPLVKLGDKVQFRIESEKTGRLIVLDSGPDGKLRRIFPNAYSDAVGKTGIVKAGSRLTIPDQSYPFEFTATDPGAGTLMVLVTDPGADFGTLVNSPDFEVVDDAGKALVALAADVQDPPVEPGSDEPNLALPWAFVAVPYAVAQ